MPSDTAYADDCDFFGANEENLRELLPSIEKEFSEWNLKINTSKTDFVNIYVPDNPAERGEEAWRKTKILGSKMDTSHDINNRLNLGCTAFEKYKQIWIEKQNITQ